MKKRTSMILAVGLFLLGLSPLAWLGVAHAQTFRATTDERQVVNSALYSAGQTVDIRGVINGDVFCAGQSVNVDATVHGDVICAGQDVTIAGKVDGDVRVAGQTVSVAAKIDHSLTAAAQTFTQQKGATVGQDATITGNVANLKGAITRDAVLSGSNVTLANLVGRNVRFHGDKLTVRGQAQVNGKLIYFSNRNADISGSAQLHGVDRQRPPAKEPKRNNDMMAFSWFWYPFVLVMAGFFALVLVLLFPRHLHRVSGEIARNPGKTVLVGFLASIAVPFVLIMLFISILGIPLALTALLAWLLLGIVSGPVVAYYVGGLLLGRAKHPVGIMLLGTLVVITLYFVPILGLLAMLLAYWIGMGALLCVLWQRWPKPTFKN